ncbi:MAG: hypothetical protein MUC88_01405 [Planctomycetes bacterium]|jgi:hypothetical protein|nr:hypothetical protein [Planctomycetota bacterium]
MLELQENIAKAQAATVGLRRDLVDRAVGEYFVALDSLARPRAGDFQAAEARARAAVRRDLLSASAIGLMDGGADAHRCGKTAVSAQAGIEESAVAGIALSFEAIARPLRIPEPAGLRETKTVTLALAAAAGAVGGMLGLAPLLRLALDKADLGLLLGAPLGAWLAVLIAQRLARFRWLTRILPWIFTRPKALRGAVRAEHERAVRICVEQWVDWAVPMLAVLCVYRLGVPQAGGDRDKALRRIGKLVYALQHASAESLPVVAHELIQEAKNTGFEGLEGLPEFLEAGRTGPETLVWKPDLASQYETFGHIVEGDPVVVERPAVVFGGQVVQRGLVRKVRERTTG